MGINDELFENVDLEMCAFNFDHKNGPIDMLFCLSRLAGCDQIISCLNWLYLRHPAGQT